MAPVSKSLTPICMLILLVLLLLHLHEGLAAISSVNNITAIFIFGDSIVDPGNNNDRLTTAKANFPPYGQDFPGHKATGRFSNGLVPGDLLASRLGVKELLPPYLGVELELNDLLTGVAFASGGSGYDPTTSKLATAISSDGQLELFQHYKEEVKALVGEETMEAIIAGAIYFTVMGSNDIANDYFINPLAQHEYDINSYTDKLVSLAVDFTEKLNQMGAKKIAFVGLPPIGCLPSQRTIRGGPSSECELLRNQAAELFNSKIRKEITRLSLEHEVYGARFIYLDIYNNLLDLIQKAAFYGFSEATEGCCGSTILDAAIFIEYHSACPNVSEYLFWDSFHPSEKAYRIVIDKLFDENMRYLM